MEIERVPVDQLNPAPYNPRKDLKPGDPEYERLKRSIDRWDIVEPLVWNKTTGNVVGGHQRLKILKARGDTEVDVSVVEITEQEEAALNIALNKISGDWDIHKLAEVLSELDACGFDATLTGFDIQELEELLSRPLSLPEFGEQSEPVLKSQRFIEVYCSDSDVEVFYPTLEEWSMLEGVTVNIS